MPITALKRAIANTKIEFSIFSVALAALIIIGSFFLVDYLRGSIDKTTLFLSSIRYRAEYIAQSQGVSLLAAAGSALSSPISAKLMGENEKALGVPVLTYHSILEGKVDTEVASTSSFEGANVSIEHFKDQMFALKSAGWNAITYEEFDEFVHGTRDLPEKSFLITFDDGAKDSFYPVEPLLAALDFNAVAFILPSHSLGDRSTYYLNKRDLDIMLSTGHWEIESHGQDIHVSLPVSADGNVKDNALSNRIWLPAEGRLETHEEYATRIGNDLALSKQNLEQELGISVHGFAFPFGDYGQNASNDSEGQATILAAAARSYSLAFYQNWNKGNFAYNYPNPDAFLVKRIPVGPLWSGKDLLAVLDASAPKPLPYAATTSPTMGWAEDWGNADVRDGVMHLYAAPDATGALAILDGTYTWKDYEVKIPVEWEKGYVMALFNMQSGGIGRACVFADNGVVQLQERTADDIFILREVKSKKVKAGEHTIGAVSVGTTSACTFDGEYIIDATLPASSGGIGVEAWSPNLGEADAYVKNIVVEKQKE